MTIMKNDKVFKTGIDFNSEENLSEILEEIAKQNKESQPILVCPVGVIDLPKKIVEEKGLAVTVITFDEWNKLNPDVDLTVPVYEPNPDDLKQMFEEQLYHNVPTVEQSYTESIVQQVRRKETVRRKESEKWARRNWRHK